MCFCLYLQSLPTRGAWVEIYTPPVAGAMEKRRSPHGERGLKSFGLAELVQAHHVAPHTGSVG